MPIRYEAETAVFDGACTADEAMGLLEWMEAAGTVPRLDLGRCTGLHTALLQPLMAARVVVAVEPENAFLKRWVLPVLSR